jgi:hypothetical protein
MERLGVAKDRSKLIAAWAAEKLGRFKLNGRLLGYSPLSRVEELELLTLGVEGKLLLWEGLARVAGIEEAQLPVDRLIERARRQRGVLQEIRLEAVELAFGS